MLDSKLQIGCVFGDTPFNKLKMLKIIQIILLIGTLAFVVVTMCSCGSYTMVGNCKYYKSYNNSTKYRKIKPIGF